MNIQSDKPQTLWLSIASELEKKLGNRYYQAYFTAAQYEEYTNGILTISVLNASTQNQIRDKYLGTVLECAQSLRADITEVRIKIRPLHKRIFVPSPVIPAVPAKKTLHHFSPATVVRFRAPTSSVRTEPSSNVQVKADTQDAEVTLQRITSSSIQEIVAQDFGLSVVELLSRSKERRILAPRQIAMYLCHELTKRSNSEIAWDFRSTQTQNVNHSIKRVGLRIKRESDFASKIVQLRRTAVERAKTSGEKTAQREC